MVPERYQQKVHLKDFASWFIVMTSLKIHENPSLLNKLLPLVGWASGLRFGVLDLAFESICGSDRWRREAHDPQHQRGSMAGRGLDDWNLWKSERGPAVPMPGDSNWMGGWGSWGEIVPSNNFILKHTLVSSELGVGWHLRMHRIYHGICWSLGSPSLLNRGCGRETFFRQNLCLFVGLKLDAMQISGLKFRSSGWDMDRWDWNAQEPQQTAERELAYDAQGRVELAKAIVFCCFSKG